MDARDGGAGERDALEMAVGDRAPADLEQPLRRGTAERAETAAAAGGENDDMRRSAAQGWSGHEQITGMAADAGGGRDGAAWERAGPPYGIRAGDGPPAGASGAGSGSPTWSTRAPGLRVRALRADDRGAVTRPALLIQMLAANAGLVAATVLAATLGLHVDPAAIADQRGLGLLTCAVLTTVLANGFVLRRRFAPLEQLIAAMEGDDHGRGVGPAAPPRGEVDEVGRLRQAFRRSVATERARSAGEVLMAREAERARVARDVLRVAAALRDELGQTHGVAAQALEDLHRLARDLRPAAPGARGLAAGLHTLVGDAAGLDARLQLESEALDALGEDGRIVAYRVVQEAMSNVARHAGGRRVCVSAVLEDAWTVVRVDDDGRGCDARAAAHGPGLTGMRERAALAGGSLAVRSVPGEGTLVELRLPPAPGRSIAP